MNRIQSILAVVAMTVAASAGAQTLKMAPQVVGVTTYEASTAVNLVVVKPEIKLDNHRQYERDGTQRPVGLPLGFQGRVRPGRPVRRAGP